MSTTVFPDLSSTQFLLRAVQTDESANMKYLDGTIWVTTQHLARMLAAPAAEIQQLLQQLVQAGELEPETSRIFPREASHSSDQPEYCQFYNLDAVIAASMQTNSPQARSLRKWTTAVLRQVTLRGYVLDKQRLINGSILDAEYFEHLQAEIEEIRLSSRSFAQRLTDLYATACDYDAKAPFTRSFYTAVLNSLVINSDTPIDPEVASLHEEQLEALLQLAENRARKHLPTTMAQWAEYMMPIVDE